MLRQHDPAARGPVLDIRCSAGRTRNVSSGPENAVSIQLAIRCVIFPALRPEVRRRAVSGARRPAPTTGSGIRATADPSLARRLSAVSLRKRVGLVDAIDKSPLCAAYLLAAARSPPKVADAT
jgi:hypothetical protein